MSPRGGKREHAGGPRLTPDEKDPPKHTIAIPTGLGLFAKDFGDGNISAGVRRALELARDIAEANEESD